MININCQKLCLKNDITQQCQISERFITLFEKNKIMRHLEADLTAIELCLESKDYDRVLTKLYEIKSEFPDYHKEETGYLIDFYFGQALFRKEMKLEKKSAKRLVKAREFLDKSLKLNDNFADTHILIAYTSMTLAKQKNNSDQIYNQLNSLYHLNKAISINNSLEKELYSKIQFLEEELTYIPEVTLCSIHEDMALEWMIEFEEFPWIKITPGNILDEKSDALVSPANSFGFMDGGLDYKLSEYFGWGIQETLQEIIKTKHNGELLVGEAEIIETNNEKIPYLISAPTMRVPMEIKDTMNHYLATRATFIAINDFNSPEIKIKSVSLPSMGTGVGKVPFDVAARQMRAAYEDVVLKRANFPEDFAEAQQKQRVLSLDHYHKLYKGKY